MVRTMLRGGVALGVCALAALACAQQGGPLSPSRLLEGASLPLRTVELPMFVRRGDGPLTPLPFLPSLQAGDQLVIRRPGRFETDVTVMAAALSAQGQLRPVHRFWDDRRAPRPTDDLVLTVPEEPSVVVVMVALHSTPRTHGAMRRALEEQADRLVESASVFALTADQRNRWNLFFDALQTMPAGQDAVDSYQEYARRVARDVGLRLPAEMDFNDSASVRQGVLQVADALEKLRNSKPEDLQRTYAGLVAPLIPGPYRDYVDVAYAIYKLAFRPRVEPRLVFAPAATAMADRETGRVQLVASRAFPRSGPERTVAYVSLPVGRSAPRWSIRPSQNRVLVSGDRVVVRLEEGPRENLLGSPFLWNWRLEVGDTPLPAVFEPGVGLVARVPESAWDGREAMDARALVQLGAEGWVIEPDFRLVRARPVEWTVREEDRMRVVSGASFALALQTERTESVVQSDIEAVTFVSATGQRIAARSFGFDPATGALRAQFTLTDASPGMGALEVKLRHLPEPFVVSGLRCFSAMPGLVAFPARVGDRRVTVDQDHGNRVKRARLAGSDWLSSVALDAQNRTVVTLPSGLTSEARVLQVQFEDGRVMDLPLTVRPPLPQFLAAASVPTEWVALGQGARLALPAGLLMADAPLQLSLTATGPYLLVPNSTLQIGLKPRGADPEATTLIGTVPRALAIWDDAEGQPRWMVNASMQALFGNEATLAQGQLMVRVVDGPDLASAWTAATLKDGGVFLVRTPVVRSIQRGEAETAIEFNANSGVLGVSLSLDAQPQAPALVPGGGLRVVVPGSPSVLYVRLAGVAARLEVRLP